MEVDLHQLLSDNPLLLTFVVIGLGYLLGRVRVFSIPLGSTTGVLIAGLGLGALGLPDRPAAATFGFALFMFSVGVQAGPGFFGALREDGARYVGLAVVVAAAGGTLAACLAWLLGLEPGLGAGLLAGAMTSTPTLAGAQDAIASGLARLPGGMTAAQAATNLSVGYALTYVFGTVGLIVLVRYVPALLGIDLRAAAGELARERGIGVRSRAASRAETLPVVRAYRVGAGQAGHTLGQLRQDLRRRLQPLRVRRDAELLDAEPTLELREGDVVAVVASLATHRGIQEAVGEEVLDPGLLDFSIVTREIVVSRPAAGGRPLGQLEMPEEYGCFAVGLTRAGIELGVEPATVVQRGDRLRVVGEEARLARLAGDIGYLEESVEHTDLLTFSLGIVAGVLLGLVVFKVGGISIGLGMAGGLLLTGIAVGFLGSLDPTFGHFPAAARSLVMDLGLVLFMAQVGLRAGAGIGGAFGSYGPVLVGCGVLVTILPLAVGYAVGRHLMGLNPALLLGALTGAMTSTPSLQVVSEAADSPVPALGYAGTYTFANVLLTFAGSVLMML